MKNRKRGYTLVELVLVMAIIAIIMGVAATAMKRMSKSKSVSTAIPLAESVFDEARSRAMATGKNVRVYIHGDTQVKGKDKEKFLRYLAVAENVDSGWELVGKGVSMPPKAYFSPADSLHGGTDSIRLPGSGAGGVSCYYYEYNAEGKLAAPSISDTDNPARFIVVSGTIRPGESEPVAEGKKTGFAIWKTGRTAKYRHPNQIKD